jgi:hypothetical protein
LASKLLNLKPTIDNREPKKYNHINNSRMNNLALRQRQIDQENTMLLKKMLNIIKRKNSSARENLTTGGLSSNTFIG